MNIANINTKDKFYELSEIWYKRISQLIEVWQDKKQSKKKRYKAKLLFLVMFQRVMHLNRIEMQLNRTKCPGKLIKGEYVINK